MAGLTPEQLLEWAEHVKVVVDGTPPAEWLRILRPEQPCHGFEPPPGYFLRVLARTGQCA